MVSKKHWKTLYQVLHGVDVSVLQLQLPQHAAYFGGGDGGDGGSESSAGGIWKDFDCFFLATDDATVRQARRGSKIFDRFKRVLLLETDPACVRVLEPFLRSLYDRGVSVCMMRVGLDLVKSGAFRLEPPGRDGDGEGHANGTGERLVYEGFKQHGHGGADVEPLGGGLFDDQVTDTERRRLDGWEGGVGNQQVVRQANTSLGDTSFARPAPGGASMPANPMMALTMPHETRQLASNLFSDREDSFLHDPRFGGHHLDRHSAPDAKTREQLVHTGWKSFDMPEVKEFDASPFLLQHQQHQQWNEHQLPSPARALPPTVPPRDHAALWGARVPAPMHVRPHTHVPVASPASAMEYSGSLFHHENTRPHAVEHPVLLEPNNVVGDVADIGDHYGAFMDPSKMELNARSPFSPLDVYADDPPTDGGTGTPTGGYQHQYPEGRRERLHSETRARSPYLPYDSYDRQDPFAYIQHPGDRLRPYPHPHPHASPLYYDAHHHHHHQHGPSPFYARHQPRTASPQQLATPPPRFWPQPMNQVASFKHIEKMYDEMRAGRPKRRPQAGKGREKFKKFK